MELEQENKLHFFGFHIIFDSNYLTFGEIIKTIERLSKESLRLSLGLKFPLSLGFKILPKGSNFIIGRGSLCGSFGNSEVILFDLN